MHSLPMDDVVMLLFNSLKLLTDDDLAAITFAPSEYLKNRFLIRYLQQLKLPVWLMICDVLHNSNSTRSIGSQLRIGKLLHSYVQ